MDGGLETQTTPACIALTAANFVVMVNAPGITLVAIHAQCCGPCMAFAPVFEQAAAAHPDVVFARIDAEAHPDLVAALQVTSVPALLVFRDGVLLLSRSGVLPKAVLHGLVNKVRGLDMQQVAARAV